MSMGTCENCKYAGRPPYKSPCSECIAHSKHEPVEVRTNGESIRAKSDEELAKVFTATVASGCPPKMDWDCAKDKNGWDACDACWCKWLQQPAEEVSTDA